MNIGDTLHTAAEREAAPIGAVITLVSGGPVWTKEGPNQWTSPIRTTRPDRDDLTWAVDNSGSGYRVVAWPGAPATATLSVGDRLHTAAEREAAPIGAVIRLMGTTHPSDTWTKTAADTWTNGDGSVRSSHHAQGWAPDHDRMAYDVVEWPTALSVGDVVTTAQQFVDLPVGSVLQRTGDPDDTAYHFSKTGMGWECNGGRLADPRTDGFFTVRSLPGQVAPLVMAVGQHLTTDEQREAAPIGARIVADCQDPSRSWTKTGLDVWTRQFDGQIRSNRRSAGGGDWYGPDTVSNGSHYVVTDWPVAPVAPAAEVSSVADYTALLVLPVGSVFCFSTEPEVRWEVTVEGHNAVRVGDPVRVPVGLSVFAGPANAGHLRSADEVVEAVEEPRAYPAVGEWITERAQFTALPTGAVIRSRLDIVRTKNADGNWVNSNRAARPTNRLRLDNYYRLVSLPPTVALPAVLPAVGERLMTLEQVVACPVGTVIAAGPNQWTKLEDGWAIHRDGAPETTAPLLDTSISLDYNTVVSYPGTVSAVPEVGTVLTSMGQFTALPVGSAVTNSVSIVATKVEANGWQHVDHVGIDWRDREMNTASWWTVTRVGPEVAAEPEALTVGSVCTTPAELDRLPVGSQIRWAGGSGEHVRTKNADGRWGSPTIQYLRSTGLSFHHTWTVERVGPEVAGPVVGQRLHGREDFDALPVGIALRHHAQPDNGGYRWVKQDDGVWRHDNGMTIEPWSFDIFAVHSLPTEEAPVQVFTIGMDIETVEQYAALPVHSVVRRDPESGRNHPVVKYGENQWQDGHRITFTDASVADDTRTLVALPQGSVTAASGCTEDHSVMVRDAVAEAIGARNEEFLTTLREHWDGASFLPGEINEVLEDLGLEEIDPDRTEMVTVTVSVEGRSTLNGTRVENMVEGSLDVRLDDDVRADWSISGMEFTGLEVDAGDCACGEVTENMVRVRLEENNVSFDSFDFEKDCSNCS